MLALAYFNHFAIDSKDVDARHKWSLLGSGDTTELPMEMSARRPFRRHPKRRPAIKSERIPFGDYHGLQIDVLYASMALVYYVE